jgi:hypothetical protein
VEERDGRQEEEQEREDGPRRNDASGRQQQRRRRRCVLLLLLIVLTRGHEFRLVDAARLLRLRHSVAAIQRLFGRLVIVVSGQRRIDFGRWLFALDFVLGSGLVTQTISLSKEIVFLKCFEFYFLQFIS